MCILVDTQAIAMAMASHEMEVLECCNCCNIDIITVNQLLTMLPCIQLVKISFLAVASAKIIQCLLYQYCGCYVTVSPPLA